MRTRAGRIRRRRLYPYDSVPCATRYETRAREKKRKSAPCARPRAYLTVCLGSFYDLYNNAPLNDAISIAARLPLSYIKYSIYAVGDLESPSLILFAASAAFPAAPSSVISSPDSYAHTRLSECCSSLFSLYRHGTGQ
jgi:hypothetical protein